LHNKSLKKCTTNYSKTAQQIAQKLHNKLLKNCTTNHSKNAQQITQKLHNKKLKKCTMNNDLKLCDDAVVKRPDGIYVLPITALKP
jgi:hypothetical protein